MVDLLLTIYLSGCIFMVLAFALCFNRFRIMEDSQAKQFWNGFFLEIAPSYILLWPARFFFPLLYALATGKLKGAFD